jgi:predicted flap endonuclease-1-like 5' DNA nuclease
MRGVSKGALTEEKANEMYQQWIEAKEAAIAKRFEETRLEIEAHNKAIFGKIKPAQKPAVDPAAAAAASSGGGKAEGPQTFADSVEQTTVESVSGEETPAAPVAEAPAEVPATETVQVEAPAPEPVVEEAAPEPVAEAPAVEEVTEEVTEEVVVEEVVEEVAAPVAEAAPAKPDDLKKIEGIGPKIAEVLTNGGIATYADLGASTPEKIREILDAAEGNFAAHDPGTWPKQGQMAADGNWDELKKWQDELDGGKEVKA